MEYLSASLFFGVTLGHLLLVPYWLKRTWGRSFSGPEEFGFHSLVFGFGSLQAVLHVLACTVGISLAAGVVALVVLHAIIYSRVRRAPNPATEGQPISAAAGRRNSAATVVPRPLARRPKGRGSADQTANRARLDWAALSQFSLLALLGTAGVLTCVLSWLVCAPQSLQILGIDSFHYHVPYAVNYAHGINLFGYLATPHLYPVGASILGAWFFQAFSDPLLLDLVNLLPFLLLFASLTYLFTLLTNEPGLDYAPLLFFLLFTGRMFRFNLFISADLLYCAAFAAVFTQLCGMWVHNKADAYDWLSLSLSTGMLLSSKIQGFMSATLLIAFYVTATAVRYVTRRHENPRLAWSFGLVGACAGLLLASGGIWLIRNWLYFGSPMAPTGLTVFGLKIFSGQSASSDWLSIAKDMRDNPEYNLLNRFLARSREWVGIWPAFLSVGLLALVVDVVYQLATQRRLTAPLRGKLFALLFFAVLFTVHVYVLITAPSSSIEILQGQTLRYIIPFYAVGCLLLYAFLVSDTLRWVQLLQLKWLGVLPALTYLLWRHDPMPPIAPLSPQFGQWNLMYGTEDLLDRRLAPLALAAVLLCSLRVQGPRQRYLRYAGVAGLAVVSAAFVNFAVLQNKELITTARSKLQQDLLRFQRGGTTNTYRGVLIRVVDDQNRHNTTCPRSRFFMMSRYDYPLELQTPQYDNVVFDVQDSRTRIRWLLEGNGPGKESCDYVVVAREEISSGETKLPAVSEDEIGRLLALRGTLETIGDSGGYRIYHVRRP